jgi:hypothetical protein
LATFRRRWDDNLRKQLVAVKATNRALTAENVALLRENTVLTQRSAAAAEILREREHVDTYVRRVLHALEGEA